VSWLDALLGRSRPVAARLDNLFGLTTATLTLETEFGLRPTGAAAICFRPVSSGDFAQLESDIQQLLQTSAKDAPLQWSTRSDEFGYEWMLIKAADFENVVTTVHMISRELEDNGYGDRLLASVFQFRDDKGHSVYWMYNYKRGTLYPFVPAGRQSRDNAAEMRLSSILGRELAVEKDLSLWYPLWGIPI